MSSLGHLKNGRYSVLKKLGEGGKGVVFKARDTVLDRVVAIKMLKSAVSGDKAYSRFMREAQAVAKLNHPNIVSIYDIGKEDETQFFVLEFVDGMDLQGLIETYPEGKCDLQTVLRVGMDICKALEYAHSQGILHRDIKPGNILIDRDGIAKLMDFGLVKMVGQPRITQEGIIVGTVAYVAPEIALGRDADARSDLYSFGAVLYEMVTGRPPFPGKDPVKIIFGHIHDYPVPPARLSPKVPPALAGCVMKLLEKEPEKRFQTAADLLEALRQIAEGSARKVLYPSRPPIVAPSPGPSVARDIRLVNRAKEMGTLRDAVDRAVRGKGGTVFLHGEAGIGKTRLARELEIYARLRGMQVLSGRCPALFRMDGVPPYALWKEVIKGYVEVCTPQQLFRAIGFYPDEVSKLVPEVQQKLGVLPRSPSINPERERDRLFEAIFQFITNTSKESPLLVVLDDLQWTDQSSLLLLHYVARGAHRESLLLLGAYRDTYVDERHPLSAVLTELNRERLLQAVPLKRLSLDETSGMIKQILEQEDVPGEFCELVYARTRGNPFFVEEVIGSLREEEVVFREGNKWRIQEVARIELPKTVSSIVRRRVNRLHEECQNVLTTASFIGRDFSFEALCGVTGIEEDRLLETLEKILETGLVKERVNRGEDVFSFADVVVRDVVHEEVSRLRHNRLHRAVALALEEVYAKKIDEHFGELAFHFLEGRDKEKALDYFLSAGEEAQKVYAHDEAVSYLQHALELLEEKEGSIREKAEVSERLGDIKAWIGEIDACLECWERSLKLWDQLADKKRVSGLHTKMASKLWDFAGDREKASEHHRMALEILENEPESAELSLLYEDISHMLWWRRDHEEALPWIHKAVGVAEKIGVPEVLASCCDTLGMINWLNLGKLEEASGYFEQGLRIAVEGNCTRAALRAYIDAAIFYVQIGEGRKAFEMAQKGTELARKAGDVEWLAWNEWCLAWCYMHMGEVRKAIPMYEKILALDERTKNSRHIGFPLFSIGESYRLLGESDKSLQYLMEAQDFAGMYERTTQSLGELSAEMGDYVQAERYLNESRTFAEEHGATFFRLAELLPTLSKFYLKGGKTEKAEELIEKTCEFATKAGSRFVVSYAEMLRGMLLREQRNWEESIEHFEESLQGYRDVDAQKWYVFRFAELLYEYGSMYLDRNQEGDKEKAYQLLDQALEIYQKTDAKKGIERILAKKKLLTA